MKYIIISDNVDNNMEPTTLASRKSMAFPPAAKTVGYDEVMRRAHKRAMQKECYSLEEAYDLIMKEIKDVYDGTPIL